LVEGQFLAQQAAAVVLHYRTIGANSGTDEMKNKKEKKTGTIPTDFQRAHKSSSFRLFLMRRL
jgi:hypothetical protein